VNKWTLLLIVGLPFLALWARAILEVFRRDDLAAVQTLTWILVLAFVPALGLAAYIVVRTPPKTRVSGGSANSSRAEHLVLLAERRQRGELADDEYRLALSGLDRT
jgi:uncharacterized membrane protein